MLGFSVSMSHLMQTAMTRNSSWVFEIGDKKVKDFGQWQFKYNYRNLEKDAWVDFWPDSDFYDGETVVEGNEFELVFGLAKNVTFGFDYYDTKAIDRNFGQDESLLQIDLIVYF